MISISYIVLGFLPVLPLTEWQTFFSVQAECAATLTGLVFVAVSINLKQILDGPGLPGRAAESIAQFLQVFFVCLWMLAPGQAAMWLGFEVLATALLAWMVQTVSQVRYAKRREDHPKWWLWMRILTTQSSSVPLVIGAVLLTKAMPTGLYLLVAGFAVSFLVGVLNAWILLIEINR